MLNNMLGFFILVNWEWPLRLLFALGANTTAVDERGDEHFYNAIIFSRANAVKVFLEQPELDINSTFYHGYSPLMNAVTNGDIKIIKLLIDAGADIHYSGPGYMALDIARLHQQPLLKGNPTNKKYDDIVEILLQAGAVETFPLDKK